MRSSGQGGGLDTDEAETDEPHDEVDETDDVTLPSTGECTGEYACASALITELSWDALDLDVEIGERGEETLRGTGERSLASAVASKRLRDALERDTEADSVGKVGDETLRGAGERSIDSAIAIRLSRDALERDTETDADDVFVKVRDSDERSIASVMLDTSSRGRDFAVDDTVFALMPLAASSFV
ncbi:hypothetical protein BDV96DRAFT_643214 [Lophiotrema nucula]|uniref:Uncharacterized protein n=1 Tax=Lophiotrema nucula TaxID=690887 RepID=A0A6A5ZJL3_9PLEO|nr:hypothetical protein BDV96DRAFT_643214 [Lophiotrema nucula]